MRNLNEDLEKKYRTPLERIIDEYEAIVANIYKAAEFILFGPIMEFLIILAGSFVVYWVIAHDAYLLPFQ